MSVSSIAQRSRIVAELAVIAIVGCIITSLGLTLARVGSVADAGASSALAHNANLKRSKNGVARLERAVISERNNGGCGKNCRDIKSDLTAAKTALAGLGSRKVVDPAGERLEAVFGGFGVTADRYRTAHPVIVAGTLELGVSLLLTIAGMFASSGRCNAAPIEVERLIDITPKTADPIVSLLTNERRAFSNREIAERLGITPSAASQRVNLLTDVGCVRRERVGRSVAIRLA